MNRRLRAGRRSETATAAFSWLRGLRLSSRGRVDPWPSRYPPRWVPTPRCAPAHRHLEGIRRLAADDLGARRRFLVRGIARELRAIADHGAGYPLRRTNRWLPLGGERAQSRGGCLPETPSSAWQRAVIRRLAAATAGCWPKRWSRSTSCHSCSTVRPVRPTGPTSTFCARFGHGEPLVTCRSTAAAQEHDPRPHPLPGMRAGPSAARYRQETAGGRGVFPGVDLKSPPGTRSKLRDRHRPARSRALGPPRDTTSPRNLSCRPVPPLGLPVDTIMNSAGAAEVNLRRRPVPWVRSPVAPLADACAGRKATCGCSGATTDPISCRPLGVLPSSNLRRRDSPLAGHAREGGVDRRFDGLLVRPRYGVPRSL